MLQQTCFTSPLGALTLVGDDQALWGVWFEDQAHYGGDLDLAQIPQGDNASLQAAKVWLRAYFAGEKLTRPALHWSGTPFRQAVQQALCQIPRGTTMTYSQLAALVGAHLGHATSPRAIGGAVGHNPLSIIVPCHRVVGADGSLTGYAGGLARKRALLALEGVNS